MYQYAVETFTIPVQRMKSQYSDFLVCLNIVNLKVLNALIMTETNDENLRRIALRRVNFRKSLYSYIVLIAFMWIIWWLTTGRITGFTGYPWPVWVMLGWGISLVMKYLKAYKGSKKDLAEEEYKKLKSEHEVKGDV